MDNLDIGKRIKATRNYKKMSLQDIADKVGVTRTTIMRYEKGEVKNIKQPTLESIAKALNTDLHFLIHGNCEHLEEVVDRISFDLLVETDLSDEQFEKYFENKFNEDNVLNRYIAFKDLKDLSNQIKTMFGNYDYFNLIIKTFSFEKKVKDYVKYTVDILDS